ncbi:unnamed protein product [Leuciscus chuanchicus]
MSPRIPVCLVRIMSHPRVTRKRLFPVRLTLFTSLTPFPPPENSAAGFFENPFLSEHRFIVQQDEMRCKGFQGKPGSVRERVVPGEVGQDSQVYRAMLFFSGICSRAPLCSPKPPPDVSDSLNST